MAEVAREIRRPGGGVGEAPPRKEDARLLRGDGRFTDDLGPRDALQMAVARCPFPHARIARLDVSAVAAREGVVQVLTGADVVARTSAISPLRPIPDATVLPFHALATEVCVFEGHPFVSVAASSRHLAEDALDAIEVEWEPLPHVTDPLAALADGAPPLHPDRQPTNLLSSNPVGEEPAAAIAAADVVVEDAFRINRVTGLPMEPRAIVAEWRPGARELTVHMSAQAPHLARTQLAETLHLDEGDVRVIALDVGGAYGLKLGIYPEDVLACLHAMLLRRPVRWVEDRQEHFRATTHARESVHEFRIAARADGVILAMTDTYTIDLGGQYSSFGPAQLSTYTFPGPYRVPEGRVERRVALTNKTPIGAYRGYGQPEVNFARERLMDRLARRLSIDPLALRLANMLTPDELPYINLSGSVYDSGDYRRCLRMAADAIDYEARRAAGPERPDGRRAGVGLAAFVERTGYPSARFLANRRSRYAVHESIVLRANRSGGIEVYTGVATMGQGAETTMAQVCAEVYGVDFAQVRVHAGDTDASPPNTGGFASRTMIAAAGAVRDAAERLRSKTLKVAAFRLGVDPGELTIDGPLVRRVDDGAVAMPLAEVHTAAILGQGIPPDVGPGLEATSHFEPEASAFAFGSAAAAVCVDPETGDFEIERLVFVHDCGTMVNPQIVEGQVRGALAQGIGAALAEELRYDPGSGQLVSGSMLDYFAPTAADLPPIELLHTECPSPVTPFGVRGAGETGTIPPAAAIANALCDALADRGLELTSLPLTPESVWRALRRAAEQTESAT